MNHILLLKLTIIFIFEYVKAVELQFTPDGVLRKDNNCNIIFTNFGMNSLIKNLNIMKVYEQDNKNVFKLKIEGLVNGNIGPNNKIYTNSTILKSYIKINQNDTELLDFIISDVSKENGKMNIEINSIYTCENLKIEQTFIEKHINVANRLYYSNEIPTKINKSFNSTHFGPSYDYPFERIHWKINEGLEELRKKCGIYILYYGNKPTTSNGLHWQYYLSIENANTNKCSQQEFFKVIKNNYVDYHFTEKLLGDNYNGYVLKREGHIEEHMDGIILNSNSIIEIYQETCSAKVKAKTVCIIPSNKNLSFNEFVDKLLDKNCLNITGNAQWEIKNNIATGTLNNQVLTLTLPPKYKRGSLPKSPEGNINYTEISETRYFIASFIVSYSCKDGSFMNDSCQCKACPVHCIKCSNEDECESCDNEICDLVDGKCQCKKDFIDINHKVLEICQSSFIVCESTIINNANGYCISSDNKIYGYNNSGCLGILNEGVHVFVMNNESIEEINLSNITDENIKNIVIYNCDSNKICKRTFGYINIESNYYVLSYSNNGSKIDYINSEISCTDINNGKLIKINDTVRLCIDEGVSVSFNDSTSPQNYIMKNDGSSIFTSAISDGIVIKSESNTLTFNNLYTDEQYCSYGTNLIQDRYSNFCNGEALNTLYDCNEGLCKITEHYLEVGIYLIENSIYECILPNNSEANDENSNVICNPSTMTGMMAFIADDEDITTYSRLINDLSDIENPENIKLYDCQKGKCDITEGYIKYDNSTSIASCDLNGCVPINSSNSSMECSKSNVGEVVVTNTNSFKICIQISGTTDYEATGELSNSGYTYSVTNDSNKYNLYISGNHGNIIGKFKIGGYDLYDIDNDNINDLVYCSISDLCQKSDKKGYFLNSRSQNSNDSLIFMDSESRYENGINGYYINSSNEVIICDSNSCEVKNEINIVEDCNNNKNTVVSINNILKYCNDNNIISFLDKNSSFDYYVYSEVDSRGIDYPKIIPTGSESIVLSVGQYEVKQYIASSEDKTLCINKHKSVTCTSGFDQYICNNNNLSCAILPNGGCNPLAELPLAKCNGYYLVKNDSFVRDTETDHSTLWNCKKNRNGNVTCNPEDISRGYFKVIDTDYASIVPYIKCNEINDCQGLEVSTETSSCNTVGIGNLIFDDNKIKICITDDVTTPVMAEFLSAKYFISIASETIFSEADTSENKQDKYTMITLNETSITLSQEHKKKYRYTFSEQKVETSSINVCGKKNEKIGQLYEFKRIEKNKNIYIKTK